MSRVMQMPPPPPLLLTKRVTAFLRANLSANMHSAMVTTPGGSLLAHASNLPASALRRQAAVAASLWTLQGPAHAASTFHDPATASLAPGGTVRTRKSARHPPIVTVQLDSGAVFVIRRLRCGMLFICMGGAEGTPAPTSAPSHRLSRSPATTAQETSAPARDDTPSSTTTAAEQQHHATASDTPLPQTSTPPPSTAQPPPSLSQPTTPKNPATTTTTTSTNDTPSAPQSQPPFTTAPTTATSTTTHLAPPSTPSSTTLAPPPPGTGTGTNTGVGSPSEASILSTHTTGAASLASSAATTTAGGSSVSLMRRHAEELARWLDERLAGLCVPEEGIGIGIGVGNGSGGVEVR